MQLTPEKITKIRIKLGLNIEQFARMIGVCPATIHKWETGKGRPNRTNLMILKEKIGIFLIGN